MTGGEYYVYAISDKIENEWNRARKCDLGIPEDLQKRVESNYSAEEHYKLGQEGFDFAEDSWDAQRELFEIAIKAGFDGVEDEDEQGTCYQVNGNLVIGKLEQI